MKNELVIERKKNQDINFLINKEYIKKSNIII